MYQNNYQRKPKPFMQKDPAESLRIVRQNCLGHAMKALELGKIEFKQVTEYAEYLANYVYNGVQK